MAKGSYTIGETANKDASFRSCLCMLLIFTGMCLLILLVTLKWGKFGSDDDKKDVEYMEFRGNKPDRLSPNEKMIFENTTTIPETTTADTTTIKSVKNRTTDMSISVITEAKEDAAVTTTFTTVPSGVDHTSASTVNQIVDINGTTTEITTGIVNTTEIQTTTEITTGIGNTTEIRTTPEITTNYDDYYIMNTTEFTTTTLTNENITTPDVDVRYTDNNSTASTEYTETATVTVDYINATTESLTTTTENIFDSMNVVEATGFDITETPFTTTEREHETSTSSVTSVTKTEKVTEKMLGTNMSTTKTPDEPICLTAGCKSVASRILSLMNHSKDPCENFYEFACGGMQVNNDNSDSWRRISDQIHLINSTSANYSNTFKIFYDSCVSHEYTFDYEDRNNKVLTLVKEVGTILDDEKGSENLDMTEIFAKLILRRSLLIMDVGLDISKETSKFIIKLYVSSSQVSILAEASGHSSGLTDLQKRCLDQHRSDLQKPHVDLTQIHDAFVNCQKDYSVLLNVVQTASMALNFYAHWNNTYNRTQVLQDLRTTIEWDVLDHLKNLPPPNEIRDKMLLKEYTLQKISELQQDYSFIEWKRFFDIVTNQQLNDDTVIQVYFPEYFEQLFTGLKAAPLWKVNNALIAMYASHLYEQLVIPRAKDMRENYCIQLTTKLFRDISSNLYMRTWPKAELEQTQRYFSNMFDSIKKTLAVDIKGANWLDDVSKTSMLIKSKKMILTFNKENDSYNNDNHLNVKYKDVTLKPHDFINNVIKMMIFDRRSLYDLNGKLFTVDYLWNYFVNIFDNYPTSFYTERLIMAPLGMMKQPVKGYPEYITMSRIGLSLAREIGRHFDPVGIQNDMKLTPESKPTYDEMVNVMKHDLLLKASDKPLKKQKVSFVVDPKLSTNERISDNTGLRLITHALNNLEAEDKLPWISTTFSKEKIFFLSVAQEYCQVTDIIDYMLSLFELELLPPPLRVENIVTNSEEFANVFNCPLGSEMNNNPLKVQFPNLTKNEDVSGEFKNHEL